MKVEISCMRGGHINAWYNTPPPCGRLCQGMITLFKIQLELSLFHRIKHLVVNASHAAGECRRQVKIVTTFVKNVEIVEFHDHIWNHNEKCIQISTNMPAIGSLIREIAVTISEIQFLLCETNARVVSVK